MHRGAGAGERASFRPLHLDAAMLIQFYDVLWVYGGGMGGQAGCCPELQWTPLDDVSFLIIG